MKRHHPSGSQKRKAQELRNKEAKLMAGAMLKYVQPPIRPATVQGKEEENLSLDILPSTAPKSSSSIRSSTFEVGLLDACSSDSNTKELDEISTESFRDISKIDEHGSRETCENNHDLQDKTSKNSDKSSDFLNATNEYHLYSDVGYWPVPMPDNLRIELIKRGSECVQNKEGPFDSVQRLGEKSKGVTRQLTTKWFFKSLPEKEKILRKWMVYSPSKKSLYCFCCKLFAADENKAGISNFVTGFRIWWKLNPKVCQHENSDEHLANLEKWKTLGLQLKLNKTIDATNQEMNEKERKKWNDLLHRLLDITLFLAKQNLAFRGHREDMTSENRGNFLELVHLLSNYDPVVKEHILRIQSAPRGNTLTYLSPLIQNEFIDLLGKSVKEKIITEIKKAKYFGILFDSTPDVSHIDQMSEVIRYVHIADNGKIEVKESFLGFFSLTGKKACDITNDIINSLQNDGLDIQLCRSQGYDNEPTMAGIHSGVQARIKEVNNKILFVPCSNHSLNLCGVHAFAINPSCVTFFATLESIYNFFSSSPHRWDVLKEVMEMTVKKLSDTRWSAHYDAVKPVMNNFNKLVQAIERLCDAKKNIDTRGSAEVLLTNICDFKFLGFLHLWFYVLQEINHAQKYLQTEGLSLEKAVLKLKSLKIFLEESRYDLVTKALQYASHKCDEMGISLERKSRKRLTKMMPGEKARDAGLTLEEETKRCMLECLDQLHHELQIRMQSMETLFEKFSIVQPMHLVSESEAELSVLAEKFCETYDDFKAEEIVTEIKRLRHHIKAAGLNTEEIEKWTSINVAQFIVDMDLMESVPNVCIALKLFLTVCVSVAANERSFSKLKLIKNYLRSTMSQTRLNGLAILSIERETTKKVDFDEVIKRFAEIKVRKTKIF